MSSSDYIATLKVAHEALRATCQLFQKGKTEFPVPNGCVVLFEYNSNYYCFSNAHVIADSQLGSTFFLLNDGTSMTVGGQTFFTKLPATNRRKDDPLDIAVVKLNPIIVANLIKSGYHFISINQVKTAHTLVRKDTLLIAGYPASKTKIHPIKNKIRFNPLILRTIPFLKDLQKLNYSIVFHHVVEYPRNTFKETTTNKITRAPKPYGISGSGLWLLNQNSSSEYELILIGILSEYDDNRALLISTKVDLFIDLLRQKFDHTIQNQGVGIDLIEE